MLDVLGLQHSILHTSSWAISTSETKLALGNLSGITEGLDSEGSTCSLLNQEYLVCTSLGFDQTNGFAAGNYPGIGTDSPWYYSAELATQVTRSGAAVSVPNSSCHCVQNAEKLDHRNLKADLSSRARHHLALSSRGSGRGSERLSSRDLTYLASRGVTQETWLLRYSTVPYLTLLIMSEHHTSVLGRISPSEDGAYSGSGTRSFAIHKIPQHK